MSRWGAWPVNKEGRGTGPKWGRTAIRPDGCRLDPHFGT
jgi:hypothetical protein